MSSLTGLGSHLVQIEEPAVRSVNVDEVRAEPGAPHNMTDPSSQKEPNIQEATANEPVQPSAAPVIVQARVAPLTVRMEKFRIMSKTRVPGGPSYSLQRWEDPAAVLPHGHHECQIREPLGSLTHEPTSREAARQTMKGVLDSLENKL